MGTLTRRWNPVGWKTITKTTNSPPRPSLRTDHNCCGRTNGLSHVVIEYFKSPEQVKLEGRYALTMRDLP